MRALALAVLALSAAVGCHRGVSVPDEPAPDPLDVGAIAFLGYELPEPGAVIGGHYAGAQFDTRRSTYGLTDVLRSRWSLAGRERGAALMRGAGYRVQQVGVMSSDPLRLRGVQYALSGRVASIDLRTAGQIEPYRYVVGVEVAWELLDLGSGAVVYGHTTHGGAQGTGSLDTAAYRALDGALEELLRTTAFLQALAVIRPPPEGGTAGRFTRPPPGARELIELTAEDLNPAAAAAIVARIAAGTVSLRGPGDGWYGSAFLLTRDGLALASRRGVRGLEGNRRARAVFASGVERPVRVLRVHRGLEVALIQVACPGDCITVDWDVVTAVDAMTPVVLVGAGSEDAALVVEQANIGGQWGIARGLTLVGAEGVEGQAVASMANGHVFAILVNVGDRNVVLLLGAALDALRVRPPRAAP